VEALTRSWSAAPATTTRQGVNELNRLIRDHRNACPGQHVKAVGFSLGAAVVHTWVTENWQTFDNVNAYSDDARGQWFNGVYIP
jgi:predicted alpha/beta-fold hydrolase